MDDATEVEVNLSTSHRNKQRHETKRVKEEEPQASNSSSNSDVKHDTMMKAIERLMVKLSLDDKNQMKYHSEPQVRNPNFRRQQEPPVPQVMQREPQNPNEE